MPLQRCLNDDTVGFDTDKGCPTVGCYRNNNGSCVTTTQPLTAKQMAAMADASANLATAITLTHQCLAVLHVEERTKRFYEAKKRFFAEADLTVGQVQAAIYQGIDWIALVHSSRVTESA